MLCNLKNTRENWIDTLHTVVTFIFITYVYKSLDLYLGGYFWVPRKKNIFGKRTDKLVEFLVDPLLQLYISLPYCHYMLTRNPNGRAMLKWQNFTSFAYFSNLGQ